MLARTARTTTRAASRAVRATVRAVRRDPVLSTLILLGVAVAVTYALKRRRKETWAWRGDNLMLEPDSKHGQFVARKCSEGYDIGDIMANEDWDYLAKYNAQSVMNICYPARRGSVESKIEWGSEAHKAIKGGCANRNRSTCPIPEMRATHPCMNKDKTKCCNAYGKNCASLRGQTGFADWNAPVAANDTNGGGGTSGGGGTGGGTSGGGGTGGGSGTSGGQRREPKAFVNGNNLVTESMGAKSVDDKITRLTLYPWTRATLYYSSDENGPRVTFTTRNVTWDVDLKTYDRTGLGNKPGTPDINWYNVSKKIRVEKSKNPSADKMSYNAQNYGGYDGDDKKYCDAGTVVHADGTCWDHQESPNSDNWEKCESGFYVDDYKCK